MGRLKIRNGWVERCNNAYELGLPNATSDRVYLGRLDFISGRLCLCCENEDHPPIARCAAIGRLRSDRLSIAKGQVSVRDQCFDAK